MQKILVLIAKRTYFYDEGNTKVKSVNNCFHTIAYFSAEK